MGEGLGNGGMGGGAGMTQSSPSPGSLGSLGKGQPVASYAGLSGYQQSPYGPYWASPPGLNAGGTGSGTMGAKGQPTNGTDPLAALLPTLASYDSGSGEEAGEGSGAGDSGSGDVSDTGNEAEGESDAGSTGTDGGSAGNADSEGGP